MRKHIKTLVNNPLVSGSIVIFLGGLLASFFSFLTNLVLSRNLTVSDYGAYVSIVSVVLLVVIPASSVVPAIVTLSGPYFAKNDSQSLKVLYFKFLKPISILGLALTVLSVFFIREIGSFLHIKNQLLIILSLIAVLGGYIGTVNLGFLQARLSFKTISFANIFSSAARLVFGFVLVIAGYGLGGAFTAFLIASLIALSVGFWALRDVIFQKSTKKPQISYRSLIAHGIPSAVSILAINALTSVDVILVKHFFPGPEAGLYAGLSLIGKVVFYLTAPITSVMFPVVVRKFNDNEDFNKIFVLSFGLVLLMSSAITAFYYLFPEFTVIFFLKKTEYLAITQHLVTYSVFIGVYSLVSLLMYLFLSLKKSWVAYLMLAFAALQAVLISSYHNDFSTIIGISITVLSLLLFILLIYYGILTNKNNAKKKGS